MWAMNGGEATWLSYGVDGMVPRGTPDPAIWLRAELAYRVPQEHVAFLSGLRLSHVEGDYFFVHAGIRPGVALEEQDPEDLLWIRDQFLESNADHGKVVVHGHSPSHEPELRANRIGIDTGACYGGPLTALVLEGTGRPFLHASACVGLSDQRRAITLPRGRAMPTLSRQSSATLWAAHGAASPRRCARSSASATPSCSGRWTSSCPNPCPSGAAPSWPPIRGPTGAG